MYIEKMIKTENINNDKSRAMMLFYGKE